MEKRTLIIDHEKINVNEIEAVELMRDEHGFTMTFNVAKDLADDRKNEKVVTKVTCDYDEKTISATAKEHLDIYMDFCAKSMISIMSSNMFESHKRSVDYTPVLDYMRKTAERAPYMSIPDIIRTLPDLTKLCVDNAELEKPKQKKKRELSILLFDDGLVNLNLMDYDQVNAIDHSIVLAFFDQDECCVLEKTYEFDQDVPQEALKYACEAVTACINSYKDDAKYNKDALKMDDVMETMRSLIDTSKDDLNKLKSSFIDTFGIELFDE